MNKVLNVFRGGGGFVLFLTFLLTFLSIFDEKFVWKVFWARRFDIITPH